MKCPICTADDTRALSTLSALGYKKSKKKHKKYNAILKNKHTDKLVNVPFGDKRFGNFRDLTGLNLYPKLIHNDVDRRRLFRSRMKHNLKNGYFSPGWFAYHILW